MNLDMDSFIISSSKVVNVVRICPWGYFCQLLLSLEWRSSRDRLFKSRQWLSPSVNFYNSSGSLSKLESFLRYAVISI